MKKLFLLFSVAFVFIACGPKAATQETEETPPTIEIPTHDSVLIDTIAIEIE